MKYDPEHEAKAADVIAACAAKGNFMDGLHALLDFMQSCERRTKGPDAEPAYAESEVEALFARLRAQFVMQAGALILFDYDFETEVEEFLAVTGNGYERLTTTTRPTNAHKRYLKALKDIYHIAEAGSEIEKHCIQALRIT